MTANSIGNESVTWRCLRQKKGWWLLSRTRTNFVGSLVQENLEKVGPLWCGINMFAHHGAPLSSHVSCRTTFLETSISTSLQVVSSICFTLIYVLCYLCPRCLCHNLKSLLSPVLMVLAGMPLWNISSDSQRMNGKLHPFNKSSPISGFASLATLLY